MGPKMPTVSLVCEVQTNVSSAIRNSLSLIQSGSLSSPSSTHNGLSQMTTLDPSGIHDQMAAAAKRALLNDIDYEEAENYSNSVQDTLKSKYIVLKPSTSTMTNTSNIINTLPLNNSMNNGKTIGISPNEKPTNGTTGSDRKNAELPIPKHVLFSRDKVQIGWKSSNRKWIPGSGMTNVGNTCYLNSTLQALFHVPAFANWLISDSVQHAQRCEEMSGIQGGCIICAMSKTLMASQQPNSQAIKPYLVYSKLRLVCKHLVLGQQEDAHEFLRYLMEAMEKAYLARYGKHNTQLDQYSKETTPIDQILGGYLKTSVRCLSCGHISVTFQHFEDLLLDIRKANTMEEALDLYFARERLEDMGYKCESCKKKVSATKQFSLERAPISLCIQLKRFSIMGNKLNKHIAIRQHLNLSKYSSKKCPSDQLNYRLVSMVTHLGASQHCGHYTAIGLTDTGSYYQFDDSFVRHINVQNVLNTNAYIIFYELDTSSNQFQSFGSSLTNSNNINKTQSQNDDRIRSFMDYNGDALRNNNNNVTTTVTSATIQRPFIGPMLPTTKVISSNSTVNQHQSGTSNCTAVSKDQYNGSMNGTAEKKLNLTNCNGHSSSSISSMETKPNSLLNGNSEDGDDENDFYENDNNHTHDQDVKEEHEEELSIYARKMKMNTDMIKKSFNIAAGSQTNDEDDKSNTNDSKVMKLLKDIEEPTLPSMPKLESNETMDDLPSKVNDKAPIVMNGSSTSKFKYQAPITTNGTTHTSTLATMTSTVTAATVTAAPLYTNGIKSEPNHRQSTANESAIESDSSSDDNYTAKPNSISNPKSSLPKSIIPKPKNSSAVVVLVNGGNKYTSNKLVPYDDSEYDSGTESPPEVNTKAGPFQVTSITTTSTTPNVVSNFMISAIDKVNTNASLSNQHQHQHHQLSNGAKLLSGRRESDSNMIVKTTIITQNGNGKRPNEWHGNETTSKLLKLNHRGYGGAVQTWNGEKSNIEKEVDEEKQEEIKRQTLSAGDVEMDRGHKKKTNSKLVLGRDNPSYNPFQECQFQRNAWKVSKNGLPTPPQQYKAQIYRQTPHKNRFHSQPNGGKFNRNGNGHRPFNKNHNHFQRQQQMNK